MRIGIVGGSASGIYFALLAREKLPKAEIVILEHEEKLAKKLYATGNGHCNFLHEDPQPEHYDQPDFVEEALRRHPYLELIVRMKKWGIAMTHVGELRYPASFSAPCFVHYLEELLKEARIRVLCSTEVRDYREENGVVLRTSAGEMAFDRVYFACGGQSGKNLGSDGSLFPVFQKHGYRVEKLLPGLSPIRVKENVSALAGLRHEAKVSVKTSRGEFAESGEVLFKKDGISGIVIFNASSFLARQRDKDITVSLDLFPAKAVEALEKELTEASNRSFYLDAYLPKPWLDYLRGLGAKTPHDFAMAMKDLRFTYAGNYGFEDSQVTLGGVSLMGVCGLTLASAIEENVYFLGEVLDVAGDCGGYNLTWCLLSALLCADGLPTEPSEPKI